MRIALVSASLLGNTRTVAEAVAAGIADAQPHAQLTCTHVG